VNRLGNSCKARYLDVRIGRFSGMVNVHSTEDVPPYLQGFTEWADAKGRFKVAVPPGTYLLGINLESPPSPAVPFAATYYPGTADGKAAKKLSVADRQNVNGLRSASRSGLRESKLPVKINWPDGKPVEDTNVWLAELLRNNCTPPRKSCNG
jgi:hypothetical protein